MGFFDNVTSAISSAVTTFESAVPSAAKLFGDGITVGVDLASGNYGHLAHDFQDLAQDMAQTAMRLQSGATGIRSEMKAIADHIFEPTSPPTRGKTPTAESSSDAPPTALASSPAPSASTSSASTPSAADPFFKQSDAELMNAVRDGKLPDSVKNDPAQMRRLQLLMNEISEINQLLSQMLLAMHDMNKAVIQNIRA
jgi:hypothetical protein